MRILGYFLVDKVSVKVTGMDISTTTHVLQVQFNGCFCIPFCQRKANPSIANATKGNEFAFMYFLDHTAV